MRGKRIFQQSEQGFDRGLRVAQVLRADLNEVLKLKFRDQRIETTHLCVEEIRVNRDFSQADIFVSSLATTNASERKKLVRVLNHAKGFLRSQLAQRNRFRTTPELVFHYDDIRDKGKKLDDLLDEVMEREQNGP